MHARYFVILAVLAALSGGAAAQDNRFPTAVIPPGGFIKTGIVVTTADTAPRSSLLPADHQPCTDSTFSELGHGHADVAGAGYASAHCPHYDVDMSTRTASVHD